MSAEAISTDFEKAALVPIYKNNRDKGDCINNRRTNEKFFKLSIG